MSLFSNIIFLFNAPPLWRVSGKPYHLPCIPLSRKEINRKKSFLKTQTKDFLFEIAWPLGFRRFILYSRMVPGTRMLQLSTYLLSKSAYLILGVSALFWKYSSPFFGIAVGFVWSLLVWLGVRESYYELAARTDILEEKIKQGELVVPDIPLDLIVIPKNDIKTQNK